MLFQGPKFPPHLVAGLIVSILGVLMSTAWGLTQNRSLLHHERFESLTRSVEDELERTGNLLPDHRLTMDCRLPGPRARTVMRVCCYGAVFVWFASAVTFCACMCIEACS